LAGRRFCPPSVFLPFVKGENGGVGGATKKPSVDGGFFVVKNLTFGELESLSRAGLAGFFAFDHSRVSRQKTGFFNQLFIVFAD